MSRILIIDDHALIREWMQAKLAKQFPGVYCEGVGTAAEALSCLASDADWNLAIVDLVLPDMSGFSLLSVLAKRYPGIPKLVLSALDDPTSIRRVLKHDIAGFVPKTAFSTQFYEAVGQILSGQRFIPMVPLASELMPYPSVSKRRRSGAPLGERFGLTKAQMRVVELLAQGKTNREIGELLGLTEGTIKVHMSAIFRAFNVNSRAQALVLIQRHNGKFLV